MDVLKLNVENDPHSDRKILNKQYRIQKKIGQGQFGKVLLAEDLGENGEEKTERYVAIKTINRIDKTKLITRTYLSHTTKIKREIQIMKECNHPNVVKLFKVIDDLKYDKILLILEYCALGEIDWKKYNHYHEKYNKTDGLTINKILRDVTNGLDYLHRQKNIVHRDLKPSNLLIGMDKTIKISDFGVSLILENNANDDKELGKTMGTPAFFAPELCQFVNNRLSMINDTYNERNRIDSTIDIWSLGVTLYCLIFHDLPFNGFNEFDLFKKIVNKPLTFPQTQTSTHTTTQDIEEINYLQDLIRKLLTKDPKTRITLNEVKHHEFTLSDLTDQEKAQFLNFNQNYIFSNTSSTISTNNSTGNNSISNFSSTTSTITQRNGFTTKIKNLFIHKPDLAHKHPSTPPLNASDLESVDDLLESYLNDSSSLGSEDTSVRQVDTSNLLDSIDDHTVDAALEVLGTLGTLGTWGTLGSLGTQGSLAAANSAAASSGAAAAVAAPAAATAPAPAPTPAIAAPAPHLKTGQRPSLSLNLNNTDGPTLKTAGAPAALTITTASSLSLVSPVSPAKKVVTVGAPSPTSLKSFFSPSKRFFARSKPKDAPASSSDGSPSISSLSKHNNNNNNNRFSDLVEPPPIFGVSSASPSLSTNSPSSRKNSMVSVRSNTLSKLTSSTSSLNLNAYLTEDAFSLSSAKPSPADPLLSAPGNDYAFHRVDGPFPDEHADNNDHTHLGHKNHIEHIENNNQDDPDDTLILDGDNTNLPHYTTMADYLDRL